MRRLTIILIICIFQLNGIYSQIVENDTVFIKKSVHTEKTEIDTIIIRGGISPAQPQVLIGTTFLPYSNKMIGLLNCGLSPISLDLVQGCDNSIEPSMFKNYPIFREISRDSTSLKIEVSVIANCCHNFLGEAELVGKDTLNLVYTSYGGFCSCECCFTLRFKFNTTMEEYSQILKFVTVNGSKSFGQIPKKNE
jgi:hypothetical protein